MDDGLIICHKQKTTKVRRLMVIDGRNGISVFVLLCFFTSYELLGTFMINDDLFVMVFLVGKTCVVWRCWVDFHCWMLIKNMTRLEFSTKGFLQFGN